MIDKDFQIGDMLIRVYDDGQVKILLGNSYIGIDPTDLSKVQRALGYAMKVYVKNKKIGIVLDALRSIRHDEKAMKEVKEWLEEDKYD